MTLLKELLEYIDDWDEDRLDPKYDELEMRKARRTSSIHKAPPEELEKPPVDDEFDDEEELDVSVLNHDEDEDEDLEDDEEYEEDFGDDRADTPEGVEELAAEVIERLDMSHRYARGESPSLEEIEDMAYQVVDELDYMGDTEGLVDKIVREVRVNM